METQSHNAQLVRALGYFQIQSVKVKPVKIHGLLII